MLSIACYSGSRAQYQNLMIHGFNDDKCEVRLTTHFSKCLLKGVSSEN